MSSNGSSVLYLSEETVHRLLDWTLIYEAVEVALEAVSKGRAIQTPRSFTGVQEGKGVLLSMPGYLDHDRFGALACKLVTSFPGNEHLSRPLPTINAHISLFDESTGVLKAVIAATEITAYRTAAASAVSTKYLLRGRAAKSLAILGAGTQGQSHAEGLQALFKFEKIIIWNRTPNRAHKLAEELKSQNNTTTITVFDTSESCVKNADVIITATYATEPILKYDWLKPGCHINAVGAGLSHHSELEEKIYREADIYVDHLESANKELVGLLNMGIKFAGEIGLLIAGGLQLENVDNGKITVSQSLGIAAEDCAVAKAVYDRFIEEQKKGQ